MTGHLGDVSASNGGRMGIVGKWQFWQLGSLALVAEILEILLGFDFLRKYGAVVDFWQKRVSNNKFIIIISVSPPCASRVKPQTVIVPDDTVNPLVLKLLLLVRLKIHLGLVARVYWNLQLHYQTDVIS